MSTSTLDDEPNPPIHRAAHHEAAHCIVAHVLGMPADYVEVDEIGGGAYKYASAEVHVEREYAIWVAAVMIAVNNAGRVAHSRHHGDDGGSGPFAESSDFTNLIPLIDDLGESIEGQRLIAAATRMSRIVVGALWPAIDALAVELSEKKRLDGEYLRQRLIELVGPRPPLH